KVKEEKPPSPHHPVTLSPPGPPSRRLPGLGLGQEGGTMNEAEWQACRDPRLMLQFLHVQVSDRKLRLFACAWCRRHWKDIPQEGSRQAVEVVEQYLEGQVSFQELTRACSRAREAADAQLHLRNMDVTDAENASGVFWRSYFWWALTAIAAY